MSDQEYLEFKTKRDEFTNKILTSVALKKVVLAGPGTGKSYLFQQICERNIANGKKDNLALSFINELVNDLSDDLYKLADVHTLHSFALSKFPVTCKMFLHLSKIISDEYRIVTGLDIDYNEIFCNMLDAETELEFYSDRRKYYNFVGPHCSIYGLIKYWEVHPDKIPAFSQILVDEYQDFNKLEINLIDQLSDKSPILVVGDDDQSLYDFKYALPDIIRAKYSDKSFASFSLPYCSRSTNVIIDAFNSFISVAKNNGFLQSRADKDYVYFPSEDKDRISEENHKIIIKTGVYDSKISYNIENEIKDLYKSKDKDFDILVIIPSILKKKLSKINIDLHQKGFINIRTPNFSTYNPLIEGFILLLKDKDCNLGWRIISKELFSEGDNVQFKDILDKSISNPKIPFKNFIMDLNHDLYKKIKSTRAILNKMLSNKSWRIRVLLYFTSYCIIEAQRFV